MASLTVLGAIVARFDASGAYADIASSGGLWVDQVPEQKALPFVILVHEGEVPEWTMEDAYTEEVNFRFEVFAVGLAAAESIATKIKAAFDLPGQAQAAAAFSITNAAVFSCQRTSYHVAAVGELEATSQQVYQCTLNYKLWVKKTL